MFFYRLGRDFTSEYSESYKQIGQICCQKLLHSHTSECNSGKSVYKMSVKKRAFPEGCPRGGVWKIRINSDMGGGGQVSNLLSEF
jgi:hypothetical protein